MRKINWPSWIISVLFTVLTATLTYAVWIKGWSNTTLLLLIFPIFFLRFFKPGRVYLAVTGIAMLGGVATIFHQRPANMVDQLLSTLILVFLTLAINEVIFRVYRARKQAKMTRRANEERCALATQSANDGIWDWDLCSNQVYLSTGWKAFLGYEDKDIGSKPEDWLNLIHPDDLDHFNRDRDLHLLGQNPQFLNEHRIRRKNGEYVWVLCRGAAVKDKHNQPYRLAGSQIDISDHKKEAENLSFRATHDLLTGLLNRSGIMDKMTDQLNQSINRGSVFSALLMIDLDGFKEVNDKHGHAAGDKLLCLLAERLAISLRDWDAAARLGGDEFAFLVTHLRSAGKLETTQIAGRMLKAFEEPFEVDGRKIRLSASLGIALYDSQYKTAEDWFHAADSALYQAKAKGKAHLEFYTLAHSQKI